MVSQLILVRHGKAEAASDGIPDEQRSLTPEGSAALAAPSGFARTFSLLSDEMRRDAIVWSSTALRARQTARAIVDVLGDRPIVEKPYLFDQDEATFLDDLAHADASCLAVVGHIPFMDRVTEYLTGANLLFTPGAAACLRINGALDPCSADLVWFVEGPAA